MRNLRGSILPVVDLAALLQVSREVPASNLLIVVDGDRRAGLPIDGVSGVGELPDLTEEAESSLLLGAVLADGDLVGMIDIAGVFDAALPDEAEFVRAEPR